MKIRTDFVTNSSSSSFSLLVKITDKKDQEYSFFVDPYSDQGGICSFDGNLEDLLTGIQAGESGKCVWKIIGSSKELLPLDCEASEKYAEVFSIGDEYEISEEQGCAVQFEDETWKVYRLESQSDIESVIGKLDRKGIIPRNFTHVLYVVKKGNEEIGFLADILDTEYFQRYSTVQKSGKYRMKVIVTDIVNDEINGKTRILVEVYITQNVDGIQAVANLAQYLMNHSFDSESYSTKELKDLAREDDWYDKLLKHRQKTERKKRRFIKSVSENIETVEDVRKIIIQRDYYATGEFAEFIAECDSNLCALAEKVVKSSTKTRKAALDEMRAYLDAPHPERCEDKYDGFGAGFKDFRYCWSGDDKELFKMAKVLHGNGFLLTMSEGCEYTELDLEKGTVEARASWYL